MPRLGSRITGRTYRTDLQSLSSPKCQKALFGMWTRLALSRFFWLSLSGYSGVAGISTIFPQGMSTDCPADNHATPRSPGPGPRVPIRTYLRPHGASAGASVSPTRVPCT